MSDETIQYEKRLFERVPCGIIRYSMGEKPVLLECNAASAGIYGYDNKEEFLGKKGKNIENLVYQYDREIFSGFFRRCIRSRKVVNFGHRIMKKNQDIAYIMGTLEVIVLPDGREAVQCIFSDSGQRVVRSDIRKSLYFQPVLKENQKKQLIIAEPKDTANSIAALLKEDYDVLTALTGQDILMMLSKKNENIAAVLVDWSILSQEDFHFLSKIKSSILYASVPIIILADQEGEEELLLSYGANEILRRPYNSHVARLRLMNLIELHDTSIQRNAVQSLVDNLPGGVVICRIGKVIKTLYASEGMTGMGISSDHFDKLVHDDNILDCIYEGDRIRVQTQIELLAKAGAPVELTFRILTDAKEIVWLHLHGVKIRSEEGEPVYQSVVSPTSNSEKMYQSMLDDAFSAILVMDESSKELLYVNSAAAELISDQGRLQEESLKLMAVYDGETLDYDAYVIKQVTLQDSRRHLVMNGKLFDWNGIKARIVYMTDDTDSYQAQLERHQLYEQEISKREKQTESTLMAAIYNISKNRLVECNVNRSFELIQTEGMYVAESVQLLAGRIAEVSKQHIFIENFYPEKLQEAYRHGETRYAIRCRMLYAGNEYHWVDMKWNLIENPNTKDLYAFVYIYDVNEEVIQRKSFSKTLGMEIESLSVLNMTSRKIQLLQLLEHNSDIEEMGQYDYIGYMDYQIQRHVMKEDRARLYHCMSIENLRRELDRDSIFTCFYREGSALHQVKRKKLRAFYLDAEQNYMCLVHTDITDLYEEQQLQNDRLSRALSEAKQANEAKSMFLSRMSHDIRTPMNAILGISRLAMDEIDNPQALEDYLNKISSSGSYLLGLINDILDMSKIESDHIELSPEPYSIKECIDFVLISMNTQMTQKNIKFTYTEKTPMPPKVMLDKMRFQQVFFNLLSNAVKFTGRDGMIDVLVIPCEETEENIQTRIVVRDNGVGIAKDSLEKVFEPFEQANQTTETVSKGSGLGLAIVKNLIQLMGGKIWVESEEGAGTKFIIDMKLDVATMSETNQTVQSVLSQAQIDFTGVKVLLVEDHPINMEIATKILKRKNCGIVQAHNGLEAVEIMKASYPGEYQAILMDVRMPVMNGLEASRAIRSQKREDLRKVPIIAMTANAFEEDIHKSIAAGMNAHLAKPIDMDLLYETLYRVLQ